MIKFMILGAPRSGTTWASNLLTTDTTMCLHDPSMHHHWTKLDYLPSSRPLLGLADTGLALVPKWLNEHPARKVILHRDMDEVRGALFNLGVGDDWNQSVADRFSRCLDSIDGLHVHWRDLFVNPVPIWTHLLPGIEFDTERHRQLKDMNIQPQLANLKVNHQSLSSLREELVSNQ